MATNNLKIEEKSLTSPLFKDGFFDIKDFKLDKKMMQVSENPLFTVVLSFDDKIACTPDNITVIERLTGALIKTGKLQENQKSEYNIINIKDIKHVRIHDLANHFKTPTFIICGDALKKLQPSLTKYINYSIMDIQLLASDNLEIVGKDINTSKQFWACFSQLF